MIQLYDELVQELNNELALCKEMSSLLEREKEVIVTLDYKTLQEILVKKQEITNKIKEIDIKRNNLMSHLGVNNKTLTDISQIVTAEYRSVFAELADAFKKELATISELNKFNTILIEKSLYYLKTSFSFLNTFDITPKQRISLEA